MLEIKERVALKPFTIFQVGGEARFFAEVGSREDFLEAINWAIRRNVSPAVIGLGSNILVSDKGFPGLVIKVSSREILRLDGFKIHVDAGIKMAEAVNFALENGLTGLEWGVGVPGTIGGSIRGNAGCFGGEMKDIVTFVEVFDLKKKAIKMYFNSDCAFEYRHSSFKNHTEWIILSAVLTLKKGDVNDAREKIKEYMKERVGHQEIGASTAGSTFKNVLWTKDNGEKAQILAKFKEFARFKDSVAVPAGFLIEGAGLKGMRIGGAEVSSRHANFIITNGNAKSDDVVMLISFIKERVHRKFNLHLEEEIQYIGFD